MKSIPSKEKFIELRAQGLSFEKISNELGVSKSTLIKWDRECSDSITNVLYFNIENLLERYRLVKKFRIEALSSVKMIVKSDLMQLIWMKSFSII